MRLVIALVVAAGATIVIWSVGRRVVGDRDSPTLAEQWWHVRQRSAQIGGAALVVVAWLAGGHALWLIPLFVVSMMAAWFASRRPLYGESWSFGQYLSWTFRIYATLAGPVMVILFAPIVTFASGVYWPEVTAVLTVLAVIRLAGSRRLLVWLLEARPLTDTDAPELRRRAPDLTRRSTAPEPDLMCTDVEGGRWANALAIAHPSSPAVVFSRPLLTAAQPDQLVAIYAHEIAHLEHYTPRVLRRRTVVLWLLTAAALALVPVSNTVVRLPWWSALAWLGAAFVGLTVAQAKHRGHETASDLRAVELCGDADAVASALILLHQLNLFPRRIDQAQDSSLTHPSLAQRLRAIRAAGDPASVAADEPLQRPFPVIVAGAHPGHYLLLERDRMSWLEGVDEASEATPDGLRAAASSTRSWTYDRLTELRVDTRRRGRDQLIAVEDGGTRRRFSISGDGVARLQLALDEVDSNLAAPRLSPLLAPFARSGVLNRAMAFVSGLLALVVPGYSAISIPLFIAAVWPRVPALTAAAAATASGLALGLLRPLPLVASIRPAPTVPLLLVVVGVILGGAAFARDRLHPTERHRAPWLVESLLGLCLAGSWLFMAVKIAATGGGEIAAYPLHAAVADTPSTVILPLTSAAVLLLRRSRQARVAALCCTALAGLTIWIGSADFRDRFATDLFVSRSQPSKVTDVGLEEVARREVDPMAIQVRLGPGAEAIAIGRATRPEDEFEPAELSWSVDVAGHSEPIDALDLRFVDRARALVLIRRQEEQASGVELRLLPDTGWRLPLGPASEPELRVDSTSLRWWVTDTHITESGESVFRRWDGVVGNAVSRQSAWELGTPHFPSQWASMGDGTALAIENPLPEWMPLMRIAAFSPYPLRSQIHRVEDGSARLSGATSQSLRCTSGLESATCVAWDRGRLSVWMLDTVARSRVLATLATTAIPIEVDPAPNSTIVRVSDGNVYSISRDDGRVTRLALTRGGFPLAIAVAEPDHVAVLDRSGSSVWVTIYTKGLR